MTREQLQKHWKVIKAYKNGADIQIYNGKWLNVENPTFSEHKEYRIKPFEPKMGDKILVKGIYEDSKWKPRIFVNINEDNKYCCLSADVQGNIIAYPYPTITCWEYAKPYKNE